MILTKLLVDASKKVSETKDSSDLQRAYENLANVVEDFLVEEYRRQQHVITEKISVFYSRLLDAEKKNTAETRMLEQEITSLLDEERGFSEQLRKYVKDTYNYPRSSVSDFMVFNDFNAAHLRGRAAARCEENHHQGG